MDPGFRDDVIFLLTFVMPARADMTDEPVVKLQALDKVSARTVTFDARVGSTVKFGSLYIKPQACRKASPVDQPESASFLQIWEITPKTNQSHWVFSGWMFASSPALSAMDHPIYDVWVLDCVEAAASTASLVPPLPALPANSKDTAIPAAAKTATSPATTATPQPAAGAVPITPQSTPAIARATNAPDDSDTDDKDTDDSMTNDDDNSDAATTTAPDTVNASPAAPPPMDATHQPVNDAPNPSSMY